MNRPELLLVLIGFGRVTRRFVQLIDALDERLDFDCRIVALSTRRHGSVVDADGIDPARALAAVESGQSLARLDPHAGERSGIDVLRQVADLMPDEASEGRLVAVESTVLDIERGEPSVSHARAALKFPGRSATTISVIYSSATCEAALSNVKRWGLTRNCERSYCLPISVEPRGRFAERMPLAFQSRRPGEADALHR